MLGIVEVNVRDGGQHWLCWLSRLDCVGIGIDKDFLLGLVSEHSPSLDHST